MANNLTDQEVVLIANIIDTSSRRGTFGAREMADVGTLWNKIAQYLQSKNITPKIQEPQIPADKQEKK